MSILREIQAAVLKEEPDLGTVLLKLRFLASRLGSEPLEDWVKYEAEGYPRNVEVPSYRIVGVTYRGTWSGPFGSGIQNAPIPPLLVEKYAGKSWIDYKVRESIAGVQAMVSGGGEIGIDASNLILRLQGKIYKDWACNSISGEVSMISVKEIKQAVRSRILEFTIELEKRLPAATEITLQDLINKRSGNSAAVTQIFNQTVYGNVTHVTAIDGGRIALSIMAGDTLSMMSELVKVGLPENAAKEVAEIVAGEKPENADQPLGQRALAWFKENAPKAANEAWKVGADVLKDVLTEAALKFYGLK